MSTKSATMTGMIVGSTIGSFVPTLWGGSVFSITSIIFTAIGGIAGIYIGYRFSS